MATSPVATQLNCTQCGGELHPDEGQSFLTCPYCGATVYLDRSRVVLHWYVAPTLADQEAVAALYRWMSGSLTVKDLDKKARVVGQSFQYFPVWYFKWRQGPAERIALQPAAATSVTELANLKIPAGDLRKYDPALDARSAQPSVPLEAALRWLREREVGQSSAPEGFLPAAHKDMALFLKDLPSSNASEPGDGSQAGTAVEEMSLVHIPLYFFKYAFRGQTYTAVVDAASGTVLANLFPAKAEAPYLLVGIVAALVYLCLALVPLGFLGSSASATTGLLVCTGIGAVAAPLLFFWAFYVASKI